MLNKKNILFCIVSGLIFLSGCVPQWKLIEKPELQGANATCRIDAPLGWVQLTGIDKRAFVTKEGPSLQMIEINEIEREKAFPSLKIEIKKDILISELADYFIAEYKARQKGGQVTHIRTTPAAIDNQQAFKAVFEYANHDGLIFNVITYGLMRNDIFYSLYYQAPAIYYFERDLPVFDKIVASFRFIK